MDENALSNITHSLTMAKVLKQQNESLQGFVQFLQSQMPNERGFTHESSYLQPVLDAVWFKGIPKDFKLPVMPVFDGTINPGLHIRVMDDQATSLRATNTLKCVLMLGKFKGGVLEWYMVLLKASILGYPDLVWNMSQSFLLSNCGKHPPTPRSTGLLDTPGNTMPLSMKDLFATSGFLRITLKSVAWKSHQIK